MPGLPARTKKPELRVNLRDASLRDASLADLGGPAEARRPDGYDRVLTPEALAFVEELVGQFEHRVDALLERRKERQLRLERGEHLGFLAETEKVRAGDWKVAPLPKDLLRRRVEITGPTTAKMVINALNSGADVFMADFEDANCPTFANLIDGQRNLQDAVRGTLRFHDDERGREYVLDDERALLMVRPRGWHLPEAHVLFDEKPIPGALFDFGLFVFHNARALVERGTGAYFYLPKLECHLEARLWNDVFNRAEELLELPKGTIRATVLIETLPAAFEMDEILFELRDHAAGLNCGRWDYLFSALKVNRADPAWLIPDRGEVTMTQPFMAAYTALVVKTCHRRGAFAMGGMAAQIPLKGDADASEAALEKVRQDKLREVQNGHDGTWVAHPGLVPVAMDVFEAHLRGDNQLAVLRDDVTVTADDLLAPPTGSRTEQGARHNVRVGVRYLEAWLRGNGCVPLYGLMEDAATAEISRTQLWQQVKHRAPLRASDGTEAPMNEQRFRRILDEELRAIEREVGAVAFAGGRYDDAAELMARLVTDPHLAEFLTLPAYQQLVKEGR